MDKLKNFEAWSDPCGVLFTAEYAGATLFGTFCEGIDVLDVPPIDALILEYPEYEDHRVTLPVQLPKWGDILYAIRVNADADTRKYAEYVAMNHDMNEIPHSFC